MLQIAFREDRDLAFVRIAGATLHYDAIAVGQRRPRYPLMIEQAAACIALREDPVAGLPGSDQQ
jgi:hypothetical protein